IFKSVRPFLSMGLKKLGNARYKRIGHLLSNVDRQQFRSHVFSQEQYFFSGYEIENKLLKEKLDYEAFRYNDPACFKAFSEEEKQAFFDLKYYLKDDLLVK